MLFNVDKCDVMCYNIFKLIRKEILNMLTEQDREKVAQALLNYRSKYNLTQQELALKLQVSSHTIFDIEHKNERVRQITITKILNKIKE